MNLDTGLFHLLIAEIGIFFLTVLVLCDTNIWLVFIGKKSFGKQCHIKNLHLSIWGKKRLRVIMLQSDFVVFWYPLPFKELHFKHCLFVDNVSV